MNEKQVRNDNALQFGLPLTHRGKCHVIRLLLSYMRFSMEMFCCHKFYLYVILGYTFSFVQIITVYHISMIVMLFIMCVILTI